MGDRANIIVLDDDTTDDELHGVVLYTHWDGSNISKILKTALAKRWRWTDPAYLTRIIFNELVGTDRGETGYGVSSFIGDNSHDYLVVDVPRQVVVKVKPGAADNDSTQSVLKRARKANGVSFKDFITKR